MSEFRNAVQTIHALREDNQRLEALLRAKDETIGELLGLVEDKETLWIIQACWRKIRRLQNGETA